MHSLWPLIFLPLIIACGDKDDDTGTEDTSSDTAVEDTAE